MLDKVETQETPASSLQGEVAAACKRWRKQRGLTLLNLADRMGTTPQTVQRLESDNMTLSIEWVERFCLALEIEPRDLFDPSQRARNMEKMREEAEALRVRVAQSLTHIDAFLEQTK